LKRFFSLLVAFVFVSVTLSANDFRYVRKISLKKDENVKILVKYGAKKKLFKLRWTLYINGGLVIHRSYDRVVSQNILYLNHINQSLRVELKPRGADFYNVPYLLVKFKEFDSKKKRALFEFYLSDEKIQLKLKYLNKDKKREDAKS
jgi:hypothetical protein